jgi:hypothetical protein
MNTQHGNRETPVATEDVRRIVALTAAIRVLCITNQVQLQRQRFITVNRPPQRDVRIDVTGPVPFGFAFTEGHEATFHVPSGHRFVIEQMHIACSSPNQHSDVQLVTRSRHMFRSLTVTDRPHHPESQTGTDDAPMQLLGSSTSTFLFSNGAVHNSSTVPPDTYVQLWGYMEPTDDALSS